MTIVNIIIVIFTALCFIGAVGEKDDKELKQFMRYGFMLCMAALLILNVFQIAR